MSCYNIKINIERTIKDQKYQLGHLLEIIPEKDHSVRSFIQRIIADSDLDVSIDQVELFLGQFLIPKNVSTRCIRGNHVYRLEVIDDPKEKRSKRHSKTLKRFLTWGQKIEGSHQKIEISPYSSQSLQDSPQSSSSEEPIVVKKTPSNKKLVPQKIKSKVNKKVAKRKNSLPTKEKQIQSESQSEESQIKQKVVEQIQSQEDSSSESSSIANLQPSTTRKNIPKVPLAKSNPIQIRRSQRNVRNVRSSFNSPAASNGLKNVIKKRVILQTSSPQESSESEMEVGRKQIIQKSSVQPKLMPFSVKKNQEQKQKLKQHKESQWFPLSTEIITKFSSQNEGQQLIKQGNEIRFKIMEFDEENFRPMWSDWIQGQTAKVSTEGCELKKAKKGDNFLGFYNHVAFVNMSQLGINRLNLNEKQLKALNQVPNSSIPQKQIKGAQQKKKQLRIDNAGESTNEKSLEKRGDNQKQDSQSVQDMVCGQLHYYFSDKNYNVDLMMQIHANQHPQKYIDVGFMLKFPKIMKTKIDKQTLIRYIVEDPKRETRNYEFNQEITMIRKKGIMNRKGGKKQTHPPVEAKQN